MAKKEYLTISGKTGYAHTRNILEINEMTEGTPCSEENREFYTDGPWQTADGTWITGEEDFFEVKKKIGIPTSGKKGFPALREEAVVCNGFPIEQVREGIILSYQGRWSRGVKKRFGKCCDILFQGAVQTWEKHPSKDVRFPFQIAFLTLTIHPSAGYLSPKKAYKELLKPYIQWMRDKFKINGYVWVREFQKNGMIHYHLCYDKFILKTELMRYWNSRMRKCGYMKDWDRKHPDKDYPSTRVEKAENPDQCAYYMQKYMSKAMKDESVKEGKEIEDDIDRTGRLWDASKNLKEGKAFKIELTPVIKLHLEKQVEAKKADKKFCDYGYLYFAKRGSLLGLMPKGIQQQALVYYRRILYAENHTANPGFVGDGFTSPHASPG